MVHRALTTKLIFGLLTAFFFVSQISAQPAVVAAEQSISGAIPIDNMKVNPKASSAKAAQIQVETQWYSIEISAKGGEITSFLHRDREYPLRDNVKITDGHNLPFQLYMNSASYKALGDSNFTLSKEESQTEITVKASLPVILASGKRTFNAVVEKYFVFDKTHHFWRFSWKLVTHTPEALSFKDLYFYPVEQVGPKADEKSPRSAQAQYDFIHTDDDFKILYTHHSSSFLSCGSSSSENEVFNHKVNFFGSASRFMVVSIQPISQTSALHYFVKANNQLLDPPQMHLQLAPTEVPKNSALELSFIVYTGPKVGDYLSGSSAVNADLPIKGQLHKDLYKTLDFGITAPIRDLIVMILDFFYKFIPNYGVGIIIFALLFKLVFFKLNQKQADSMKKMSTLQPLLKELNEKYKDNPQEKNRRLMLLYKENKVNPMSGCLPMLIQIPIFIALYSAFSDAYGLWKSPFIPGWVNDLSEPDTIFVLPNTLPFLSGFAFHLLPIFMTATQFVQTKLTMISGDSNQKKIMQFMPLIMLVFFWSMPSGVVLYWTIQNILSIAQQLYTNARTDNGEKKT